MRKLDKAGRTSHCYKIGSTEDAEKKDTFVTLEINKQKAESDNNEFTDCSHLRQVVCLLPAEGANKEQAAAAAESSDDSIDEKSAHRSGNLEPTKHL